MRKCARLVQCFRAKMHDCDFKSWFFSFLAFGKVSKSCVLKSQSTQKHVLVMNHMRWKTKTLSKFALLPLLVLHIIPKFPLFLFWNSNFTQISNPKKKNSVSTLEFRLLLASGFFFSFFFIFSFWLRATVLTNSIYWYN